MPTSTTHYGLTKPAAAEYYDVAVQNENMDKLDAALHTLVTTGSMPVADGTGVTLPAPPCAVLAFWDGGVFLLTPDAPGAYLMGRAGGNNFIYLALSGAALTLTTSDMTVSAAVRYVAFR